MKIYLENAEEINLEFIRFGSYLKTLTLKEQNGSPYITAKFNFYGDHDDFKGNLDEFTKYFKLEYEQDPEYFIYGHSSYGAAFNNDYIKAVAIIKEKFGVGDLGYFNELYIENLKEYYSDEYDSNEINKISNKLARKVKAAEDKVKPLIDKAEARANDPKVIAKKKLSLAKSRLRDVSWAFVDSVFDALLKYAENMYGSVFHNFSMEGRYRDDKTITALDSDNNK